MQCPSFVVHACASVRGHACTRHTCIYVNRARRLTSTALLVNLLRVCPPCIAVHCRALARYKRGGKKGVREEGGGKCREEDEAAAGGPAPLVLVHTRATRTYEYIHERWTWRLELPPSTLPRSPSSASPSVSSSLSTAVLLAHPLYRRP